MDLQRKGTLALVSGSTAGIGLLTPRLWRAHNPPVALTARNGTGGSVPLAGMSAARAIRLSCWLWRFCGERQRLRFAREWV